MGNPFFGDCCCTHGPPFCPLTIRLLDCCSTPIEGATVTVTISGFDPVVGTTDADGRYTMPDPNTPIIYGVAYNSATFTIAWDGATGGPFSGLSYSIYNCTHTEDFCYRHAKVTVNTTAAATPDVLLPPIVPPFVETGGGTGTIVFTYKNINYLGFPSYLPRTFELDVVPADNSKYLNNCTTVTLNCDDDVTVDVPLFEWDTDYAIHSLECDQGCTARGEGPNFRGITPKALFVTPSYVSGALGLGIYDGATIPVTWDGSGWDSGCLPAPGVRCCAAGTYGPSYGSARMRIVRDVMGIGDFYLILTFFASSDCTPNTSPDRCPDCTFTADVPATVCLPYLYSPVDANVLFANGCCFDVINFHVTE